MNNRASLLLVALLALGVTGSALADSVKGRIKYISNKANTIQIEVKGSDPMVVRFDVNTVFEGANGIGDLSPPDLITVEYEQKQPASRITKVTFGLPPGVEIGITELLPILQGKQGLYLLGDARPKKVYLAGHIPSAISTPTKNTQDLLAALPEDKGHLLVFYCGGSTCPFTAEAVAAAQQAGYSNIKGFQDGLPGWNKAKLPVHTSRVWLAERLNRHHVIIDVRDAGSAAAGHLAGAVNLPGARLVAMTAEFVRSQKSAGFAGVSDKRAPIILYSDSHSDRNVLVAFKELRSWGYTNVSILEGGYKGWIADGLPIEAGRLAAAIDYEKSLVKGAIVPADFSRLVAAPEGAVFVDVRTDGEVAAGKLKGAVHIPLDSLAQRLDSLPRDKEIIAYCENGIRAEMAYETLRKAGFKARFLNESLTFDAQGDHTF